MTYGNAYAVTRSGLGCVNLGASGRSGIRLVHRALDSGVRFFDTADAYGSGNSERVLGRALRERRDLAFVATKAGYLFSERAALERAARRVVRPMFQGDKGLSRARGPASPLAGRAYAAQDFSPKYLRKALEASLRRLDMDCVDLYQLHGPRVVCDEDVLALMVDLRSEGKIRGFGVGLESLEHAMAWLDTGALSSMQVPFGVLDPTAGDTVIPRARAEGVSVIARAVFGGGFLADRSNGDEELLRAGQPAIRTAVRAMASALGVDALQIGAWFVTMHPGVTTVLVGTSSVRHLEQSVQYVQSRAPDDILPLLKGLVVTDGVVGPTGPARREGSGA